MSLPEITLICPSRSRPMKMAETIQQWLRHRGTSSPIEVIVSLDSDDSLLPEYRKALSTIPLVSILINDNRSAVDAINKAAEVSTGNILIVVSDDFQSSPDWGAKLIAQTEGKSDWIAKTPDGIQKWIITLPIMDRVYYNRFRYIYNPEYLHMFCDTELTCVADLTGRKITLDIPFKHAHYSLGGGTKDLVSVKADSTWKQGEDLFVKRYRNSFGLVNYPGKIESPEYINWVNKKL